MGCRAHRDVVVQLKGEVTQGCSGWDGEVDNISNRLINSTLESTRLVYKPQCFRGC